MHNKAYYYPTSYLKKKKTTGKGRQEVAYQYNQ